MTGAISLTLSACLEAALGLPTYLFLPLPFDYCESISISAASFARFVSFIPSFKLNDFVLISSGIEDIDL